ncbi:MFS transporter [Lachnospiraceae bacterium 42-17]|jgi:MFS family permease|nr:MFS transporter [Dorea sp.]
MNIFSQYKGLRRENYILCFGRLVTAMGSMIWPMMTMILNQKMGMKAEMVAWVMAAGGFLALPAHFIGGKMADRFNKKMNIVYMDIISVVCYVICALTPLSIKSIVLMFTASICQNMEHPSYNALTADMTITEDRGRAYSLQYLCANLGFVMSPTIAGFLFRDYLWLAFLVSGTAIGCSSILIFFFVKDITPVKDVSQKAVYQAECEGESLWSVIKGNKTVLLFIVAVSGYYATYQMYNYLMPLELSRLHEDSGAVIFGSITSVNCAVVVIFTPVLTKMFPRLSEPAKSMLGQVLLLAGFGIFFLFAGYIPSYYAAMLIITWGEIFNVLAESPYLTKRVPASHRGRVDGLSMVVRGGVTGVYQMLIGFVYGIGSPAAAWIFVLSIGGFFVFLTVVLIIKDRKIYKNLYFDS